MTTKGTLYLIPCPISDETAPWEVLPAANRAVMDSLDYFIVENTRSARRFLAKAGIARPIDGLEFREPERTHRGGPRGGGTGAPDRRRAFGGGDLRGRRAGRGRSRGARRRGLP